MKLETEKGFYVGDIAEALSLDDFDRATELTDNFRKHAVNADDLKLLATETINGDGVFSSSLGILFGTNSGLIGIIPLEYVSRYVNGQTSYAMNVLCCGSAQLIPVDSDGVIKIILPNMEFEIYTE